MSNYAILGATGQVGGSVLKALLEISQKRTDNTGVHPKIHALVRSRSRLDAKLKTADFSSLDTTPIKVFESSDISNIDVLSQCIKDTKAVFLCVAAGNNKPGCSIAQDQAKAIIAALRRLKNEDGSAGKPPRIIVLSSAEAEETPHFSADLPWLARNFLFNANSNIYNDLIDAEKMLRAQSDWIDFVIVKPGGLSWDIARGHELSFDRQQTFISYEDLAGGMVEVADELDGKYDGKCVSVVVPSGKAKMAVENTPLLVKGFVVHFFPFLYGWLF